MASTPTAPHDSSNRVLQDRFNQDLASVIAELLAKQKELEARIVVLESA